MKLYLLFKTLSVGCICLFSLISLNNVVLAAPEVLGWLEGAYLQPWGVRVRAKLDSGALTSSIHAEKLEVFEKEGRQWARFHFPYGKREGFANGFIIEKPIVRQSQVKEHIGDNALRYVVEIDICISGDTFPVEFSLADRGKFNYPIILGRKAMAARFIIDPANSFIGNRSCPRRDKKTGKVKIRK